ncbi:MAG: LysR family transcriptional regulator, partial [Gammaproteobacteria bacterium]|nr:LysR family transcriptional regulator [Gammaproteobacteria bacterium]
QLGIELFERRGKKLILNDKGKLLLPKAANILQAIDEIQGLLSLSNNKKLVGKLIVGASSTIGNYILPKIIGAFAQQHMQTKLILQVSNTEKIIQHLLKFNIDIGMIEGHCYDPHVKVIPWKQDELVVIANPKHPLCKKKKISLNDLKSTPWIVREPGSGTREKIEEIMGSQLNIFLELGHTESIKQAVIDGFGISCLSKATVQQALKNRELIVLKTPFLKLTRDFYILLHQEKQETGLLKSFLHYCLQHT